MKSKKIVRKNRFSIFVCILKYGTFGFLLILQTFFIVRATFLTPNVWLESIIGEQVLEIPVNISVHPSKENVYLISEKPGRVVEIKEGTSQKKVILDIVSKTKSDTTEEGLLAAAIDPLHIENIYVYYCSNKNPENYLSRFRIHANGHVIPESEQKLITLTKASTGHNGGNLKFGPRGFLWLSFGDAGYANTEDEATLGTTLHSSIIRIDVNNRTKKLPYAIPSDNPFIGNPNGIREEVYVMGLRNPWRWSFYKDDQLIIADVGSTLHEEINIANAGDHLGWPAMEGNYCRKTICSENMYREPIAYFTYDILRSIIGGFVYRGSALSNYQNHYIFADYLRGLYLLDIENVLQSEYIDQYSTSNFKNILPKIPMPFGENRGNTILIVALLEDANKEVLAVSLNGGIFRVVPIDWFTKLKSFFFLWGSFR